MPNVITNTSVHETGRSAFSPVSEIVELSSTLQAVWSVEEDDCKSSIPGGVAFHCLLAGMTGTATVV